MYAKQEKTEIIYLHMGISDYGKTPQKKKLPLNYTVEG